MLNVTEVKKLLELGYGDAKIAKEFGCTRYRVSKFRADNNIPNSFIRKNKANKKAINKLKNKCKSQSEIGEKVGLSRNRVCELIREHNIEYTKKPNRLRIRKFGTWTITKRLENDEYLCRCDCGYEQIFNQMEIKNYVNKCPNCKMKHSFTQRQKMFLANYKRAENKRKKDLNKRGKVYIINNVKNVDELGRDTYVNLLCSKGHFTKDKFNKFDGCRVCK